MKGLPIGSVIVLQALSMNIGENIALCEDVWVDLFCHLDAVLACQLF